MPTRSPGSVLDSVHEFRDRNDRDERCEEDQPYHPSIAASNVNIENLGSYRHRAEKPCEANDRNAYARQPPTQVIPH